MTSPPESVHQQAVNAANSGDFERAQSLLEQASSTSSDPILLARIELTRSYVASETGSTADAASRCARLAQRADLPADLRGLAWSQLGLLQLRTGELREAEYSFSQAIDHLRDEAGSSATVYVNRGNLYLQLGKAAAAEADFAAATDRFHQSGDTLGEAKARFNLGYVGLLRHDLIGALAQMRTAGETLGATSPVNRATVQQDVAEVLLAAGRPREAAEALTEAAAIYGAAGLSRFQAEAEFVLARTLLASDPERAARVADQAGVRFADHQNRTGSLRAQAIVVQAQARVGGSEPELLTRLEELLPTLRSAGHHHDVDALVLTAARLYLRLDNLEEARSWLAKFRPTEETPITTRLLVSEVRAEAAQAADKPGQTRQHSRAGLDELTRWVSQFGSLDLQTTALGHGTELARLGLRAALRDGRAAVVYEWSERIRSLASRVSSVRPPADPELGAALATLRLTDPDDRGAVRALREQIRSRSWYRTEEVLDAPVPIGMLRERLGEKDATLVAHLVLDEELVALVVDARRATVQPLGPFGPVRSRLARIAADLDFAAQHRDGGLASAVRHSLKADLATLSALLLEPLGAALGTGGLVLTPSAALAGTPWGLLPATIRRPITIPRSARRWWEQTSADMVIPTSVGLVSGPRLARARAEIESCAGWWDSSTLLHGDRASTVAVADLAERVDLLHIASHGDHPGDNPLFSSVGLADGPWFGYDVETLRQVPTTVVL